MAALFNSISCCLDSAVIDETERQPAARSTRRAELRRQQPRSKSCVILLSTVLGCTWVQDEDHAIAIFLGSGDCGWAASPAANAGQGHKGDSDLGVRPGTVAPPPVSSSLPLVYLE